MTSSSVDSTSPGVIGTSPEHGQTGVPYNTFITLTFSEPVNPFTLNSNTFIVSNNGDTKNGRIVIGAQNNIATFIPASPFFPQTQVDVTLTSDVIDIAGNSIIGDLGAGTDFTFQFTTATVADRIPPRIMSINPPDNAIEVNIFTSVSVVFDDSIDPTTVDSSSFVVSIDSTPVIGRLLFSNYNTVVTFLPDEPLTQFAVVDVSLKAGISDLAGNAMPVSYDTTFTTQLDYDNYRPSVIAVSPYRGQGGVPLDAKIVLRFDERIDPTTITGSTFYVKVVSEGYVAIWAGRNVSADGLTATLTPSQPLLPNSRYTVYYTTGIKDIAGNQLFNYGSYDFYTGTVLADDTSPGVTRVSPKDGATGVKIDAKVLFQFSEPVAATTVNNQTVIISAGGVPVEGWISLERGNRVVRWQPANLFLLEPNTFYEVTVKTDITDTAGNPLSSEFTSSFMTGAGEDNTRPTVVSISPANYATNVSKDSNIVIRFSEPINPITVHGGTLYLRGPDMQRNVSADYIVSEDRMTVTLDPTYLLFAGEQGSYYTWLKDIEDISGNKLNGLRYYFRTETEPGTDGAGLPTSATVIVNPDRLYADGETTTTVTISNINRNGALVPNGTKIAVAVASVFRGSYGGTILGGVTSASDSRFKVFTTLGGRVTFTYQTPNLSWMAPGWYRNTYIQVASIDEAESPIRYIGNRRVELFRGNYTSSITTNPRYLQADGVSNSNVRIVVYGRDGLPVPPGKRVGVSVDRVYNLSSAGGTINGGEPAQDSRFRIFTTVTGGIVNLTYTSANRTGTAYIQVVNIDDAGRVTGRLGIREIYLGWGSSYYTAPQPEVLTLTPHSGQWGVGLNALVVAGFSQPLDSSTLRAY